ncbi:MAG: periplasmic heavy metal sensor [Phycisphaerae bacterium]|nr:periplasmic heavy metal sensor [Phycisphaerae bacterium]
MIAPKTRSLLLWSAVLFAGSFAATVVLRASGPPPPPPDPLARALGLSPEDARALHDRDPSFGADLRKLRDQLDATREDFARLLEDPSTPEQTLRDQIDRVIDTHNQLERRVFEHILALREELDPKQRRALLSLCAEGVRRGPRAPWRHRGGRGELDEPPGGPDGGGPPGWGRGRGGPGRGRGGPNDGN